MAGKSDDVAKAIGLAKDTVLLIDAHPEVVHRLDAGTRDQVASDYSQLSGEELGSAAARRKAKGATSTERALAGAVFKKVTMMRRAVGTSDLDAGAQKQWGRGAKLDERVNKTLLDVGNTIVDRASTHPAELASAGLTAADVDELRTMLATLTPADREQGAKKSASKDVTRSENAAIKRIYDSARKVGARGAIEFATRNPSVAAEFEALHDRATPPSGKRTKKKPADPPAKS